MINGKWVAYINRNQFPTWQCYRCQIVNYEGAHNSIYQSTNDATRSRMRTGVAI